MTENINDVIARYRQGAIATGVFSDPKKANKGAEQLHACYKVLRESDEGRDALVGLMEDVEPILDRIVAALFDSLDAFAAREKADMRASWPQERDILLAELEVLRQTVYHDLETASEATLREIDALSLRLATDADSPPRQLIDHMIWRLAQLLGAGLLVLMLLAAGAWWLWRRQSVERSGGR